MPWLSVRVSRRLSLAVATASGLLHAVAMVFGEWFVALGLVLSVAGVEFGVRRIAAARRAASRKG